MARRGSDIKKALLSTTGIVAVFFILILINVIVSYANIRWDATDDKIYSLSKGTLHIIANLKQPVEIKFFYSRSSKDVPDDIKLYAERVRDFLSEYEHASDGRIKVENYDPKPDSDAETWAQKYSLRVMQTPSSDKLYCGLVFLSADQVGKIAFLDPGREELLEYDITRVIQRLENPRRKVIGVISGLPVFGGPSFPGQQGGNQWLFITELKKSYKVRDIPMTASKIDPAPDLLLVIHPKGISQKLQYAIDQYVLSGGKAIVFVDPFCISDTSRRSFMGFSSSSLDRLFKAWGVSMPKGKVVADMDQQTPVRTRDNRVENSPVMISARGQAFNSRNVITAGLESMLFPLAGAIEKVKGSKYALEPLVRTGKDAGLVDAFKASLGVDAVRRAFVSGKKPLYLAVQVRGKFKTAFPDGPPVAKKDAKKNKKGAGTHPAQIKEARKKCTVIILGDADLLADRFYVQRGRLFGVMVSRVFNDNLNFLSNASETLTGSNDLIALRTRGRFERPFTVVLDLQRKAQEKWLAKEKDLMREAEATNRKLKELEGQKEASQKLILNPEQEKEIARFRREKQKINNELKEVRKNLRADIENLGNMLKAINIFLMPFLVIIAGLGFAFYKHRRMTKR